MGKLLKNNRNLKNIKTLMLIILIIIAITSITLLTSKPNKNELLAKINNKPLMEEEDTENIETASISTFEEAWSGELPANGTMEDDYGIVESANISIGDDSLPKIADGTEPFDSDDEVGNDSSNKNRIVRSFDAITYNVDIKLKVNEEKYTDLVGKRFTGGYLYIEATLNENNNSSWKTTEMTWLKTNAVSKVDGKKLYVVITLNSDEEINSKIIKDLPFVVNASYTQNEKTILPTIKVWLKGNTDDEKKDVTGIEQVKVTATENYNVKIKKGDKLWGVRQKLNYDGNEITGRMFGIGIATTLYNNSNIQKGVRGKTVPSGKIEINTSIKILNDDGEDITSSVNPLIWNYSLNGGNGIIPDRNMYFSVNNTQRYRYFPFGKLQSGYTTSSVYDSGKVNITQNGNIITTTIEDYKFNGQFPQATIAQTLLEANEGYFASLYLQIIVPETEYKGNYTIILNEGGEEETKVVKINGIQKVQARSDDDHIETKVDTTIKGEYGHVIVPLKDKGYKNTKYLVDGNYNPTHAEVTKNQIFVEEFRIQQSSLDVRS